MSCTICRALVRPTHALMGSGDGIDLPVAPHGMTSEKRDGVRRPNGRFEAPDLCLMRGQRMLLKDAVTPEMLALLREIANPLSKEFSCASARRLCPFAAARQTVDRSISTASKFSFRPLTLWTRACSRHCRWAADKNCSRFSASSERPRRRTFGTMTITTSRVSRFHKISPTNWIAPLHRIG